jgi:calcium/calmodulin-dependent protein kinase I
MGGGASTQVGESVTPVKISFEGVRESLRRQSSPEVVDPGSFSSTNEFVKPNIINVPILSKYPYLDFKLLKKIGTGKFSIIYKAISLKEVGLVMAIKEVRLHEMNKQQLFSFRHELNILSQLRHHHLPRIASVYDPMPSHNIYYVIMDHIRGGELIPAICRQPHYMESDAKRFILALVSAIHYLHQHGVIHGFIIPENLVLSYQSFESTLKLVDFTYAECESHRSSLLVNNNYNNLSNRQLHYLADFLIPELTDEKKLSYATDIWCIGAVAHVMLKGMTPFTNANVHNMVSELFMIITYVLYTSY